MRKILILGMLAMVLSICGCSIFENDDDDDVSGENGNSTIFKTELKIIPKVNEIEIQWENPTSVDFSKAELYYSDSYSKSVEVRNVWSKLTLTSDTASSFIHSGLSDTNRIYYGLYFINGNNNYSNPIIFYAKPFKEGYVLEGEYSNINGDNPKFIIDSTKTDTKITFSASSNSFDYCSVNGNNVILSLKNASIFNENMKNVVAKELVDGEWKKFVEFESKISNLTNFGVVLILDISNSLGDDFGSVLSYAKNVVDIIKENSNEAYVGIVDFSTKINSFDFSNSVTDLKNYIGNLEQGQYTAMYDALGKGISLFDTTKLKFEGKAVIVFTDGTDNYSSAWDKDSLIDTLQSAKIKCYTIGLEGKGGINDAELTSLAVNGLFKSATTGNLELVFKQFAQSVSNVYSVDYTRNNQKIDSRKIKFFFNSDFVSDCGTISNGEENYKNSIGMEFVFVGGGNFDMGSTSGDSDEKPVHSVTISKDYYIGKYEVTQAQWVAVMGSNPSKWKGDNLPVEQVSWNDIQEFITKLNQMEGTDKYSLPTEAQWEFAAKGGNKGQGYTYSGSNTIGDVAWYSSNSSYQTHQVGTKKANELGIYDMSGNVWEWCSDWYGSYSSAAVSDPTGASTGSSRVLRGSSLSDGTSGCRVADRGSYNPSSSNYNCGFRIVYVAN